MENKRKLIYYTLTITNIVAAIIAIIEAILTITPSEHQIGNILYIIFSGIMLLIFGFYLFKLTKKGNLEIFWLDILGGVFSLSTLVSVIYMLINFSFTPFIIFGISSLLSSVLLGFSLFYDDGQIRYNHVRRTTRKSPTCTIQISTEYLIKKTYTQEEAQKTLDQLYSIHDKDGFSMEEFEKIKEKIINNTIEEENNND